MEMKSIIGDGNNMKETIADVFDRLQKLDIVATQGNMEILLQCLYDLKHVYQELERVDADAGKTVSAE